jgi:hypothetical protein
MTALTTAQRALEFYASPTAWQDDDGQCVATPAEIDAGAKARAALRALASIDVEFRVVIQRPGMPPTLVRSVDRAEAELLLAHVADYCRREDPTATAVLQSRLASGWEQEARPDRTIADVQHSDAAKARR